VLQDFVSSHTENWMSFVGAFFVLVVLFFPRGVLGLNWRALFTAVVQYVRGIRKHRAAS
jgi:ABC-type branched-subunit amino acid transport system permease subunit